MIRNTHSLTRQAGDCMKTDRDKGHRLTLDHKLYKHLWLRVFERDGWRCQSCGCLNTSRFTTEVLAVAVGMTPNKIWSRYVLTATAPCTSPDSSAPSGSSKPGSLYLSASCGCRSSNINIRDGNCQRNSASALDTTRACTRGPTRCPVAELRLQIENTGVSFGCSPGPRES